MDSGTFVTILLDVMTEEEKLARNPTLGVYTEKLEGVREGGMGDFCYGLKFRLGH